MAASISGVTGAGSRAATPSGLQRPWATGSGRCRAAVLVAVGPAAGCSPKVIVFMVVVVVVMVRTRRPVPVDIAVERAASTVQQPAASAGHDDGFFSLLRP